MSRITKEEIEKTKCGRFLLSDENIYLSIYSLNSYVFEYNLLNTEDRILYHRLQDKFDARLINGVITRVREQIIELFDKDKYIEAKVYFKPKKLSENGELEFRPLHSTGLITQIAIVSMLALKEYLNRNKNNYFKCEIEIKIKCNNKTSIEARQFEILNHYIQDRK